MDNNITRIRELRKKAKLSGKEVASRVGISAPYYYDIEKGQRRLSSDLATKLSALFSVSVGHLLGNEENDYDYRLDPNLPLEVKSLLDDLVSLPAEDREKIIEATKLYIAGLTSTKK